MEYKKNGICNYISTENIIVESNSVEMDFNDRDDLIYSGVYLGNRSDGYETVSYYTISNGLIIEDILIYEGAPDNPVNSYCYYKNMDKELHIAINKVDRFLLYKNINGLWLNISEYEHSSTNGKISLGYDSGHINISLFVSDNDQNDFYYDLEENYGNNMLKLNHGPLVKEPLQLFSIEGDISYLLNEIIDNEHQLYVKTLNQGTNNWEINEECLQIQEEIVFC